MTWLYLVLIVVVIAFGIGVVVWNRRRRPPDSTAGPAPTLDTVERPPQGPGATAVLEEEAPVEVAEAPTAPVEVEPAARSAHHARADGAGPGGARRRVHRRARAQRHHRRDVGRAGGGAVAGRPRRARHRRAARRPAGAGEGQGDHRAGGTDRRSAQRDADPPRRCRPSAPLRPRRDAQRLVVRGCERRRQDHVDRQGRQPAGGRRPLGADGGRRHVPCRRR